MAADSPAGRAVIRHSTAHVLAQAVQQAFPEAKLGIGPPIENGFYYDFGVDQAFTPEDLKSIESRMRDIVKQGQRFVRREVTDADARQELAAEPYKLELIGIKGSASADDEASTEVGAGVLTIYDNVDAKTGELRWKDLCRGPHVPSTRSIPAFKLMRNAGAYWRGSEKNPQLQRIYGTAWESRAAQDEYLKMLEEAERRDHRKLGAELDLFSFPEEIGSGLPVFHPKGGIIRREMENYSRLRHEAAGYSFVNTPHITKAHLFETSGHLPYYADTMFPPMELEGSEYYLKAMNCPMHNLVFRSRGRSYRELPLRLFEFGTVYRYEKSGVVHGLTRVRGLTMDDSHIYCTREQMEEELSGSSPSSSACSATTASTTSTWSCPPRATRTSSSARTTSGSRPPRRSARSPPRPVLNWCPTRAARRSTGRRSPSRRATRSAGPGRCPPSSSTSTSPSGSASSTPPPTAAGSSR